MQSNRRASMQLACTRAWADSSGAQAAAVAATAAATHLQKAGHCQLLTMSLRRLPGGSAVSAALTSLWRKRGLLIC